MFNYLSIIDLANIGGVCQRLRTLAVSCFRTHHKNKLKLDTGRKRLKAPDGFEKILKTFGHVVMKISIYTRHASNAELGTQLLIMTAKHCKSVNGLMLRCVRLDFTGQNQETMTNVQRLMSNVTELSVFRNHLSLADPIFRYCYALETLSFCCNSVFYGADNNISSLNHHFPNLKTLRANGLSNAVLSKLLEVNRDNVRSLHFDTSIRKNMLLGIVSKVGRMRQLTSLHLSLKLESANNETHLNDLMSEIALFPALKKFYLELQYRSVPLTKALFKILSTAKNLQDIHIWQYAVAVDVNARKTTSIKLRRSNAVHDLYQHFVPY